MRPLVEMMERQDRKKAQTLQIPGRKKCQGLLWLLKEARQSVSVVWLFFSLMEESKNPFLLPRVSLSQYQPWTRADAVRPRVSAANHFPPQVHFDDGRACRWVSRRCGIRLLNERIPFP